MIFLEAHNALSAVIVEENSFDGIWASGLTISAALGLRDCNEATWSEVLQQVQYMSDRVKTPILMDADTGYGDFNIARRFASKAVQAGVWGIVIEDKIFPKRNSFSNFKQSLEPVKSYQQKIAAIRDKVGDRLKIYARCEALNLGLSCQEVVERCDQYQDFEVDGIFVHSKSDKKDEIISILKKWTGALRPSLIPTTYSNQPIKDFSGYNIEHIVFANQMLRTSIMSMQKTAKNIRSLSKVEDKDLVSIDRVFELQNQKELIKTSNRFSQ